MLPDDQVPIQYRSTHHSRRESPTVLFVVAGVVVILALLVWSAL